MKIVGHLSTALIGGLCGMLGATAVAGMSGSKPEGDSREVATARSANVPPPSMPQSPSGALGYHELGQALLAQARQGAAPAASASTEAPSATRDDPAEGAHLSREEVARREEAEHQQLLSRHATMSRDLAWANSTTSQIQSALDRANKDQSLRVQGIDCRTDTCTATIEYGSKAEAETKTMELVDALAVTGCAQRHTLPLADNPGAFSTTVYLDCSEAKYGQ